MAYHKLKNDDVLVTNQSDKEAQLPKILKLDKQVKKMEVTHVLPFRSDSMQDVHRAPIQRGTDIEDMEEAMEEIARLEQRVEELTEQVERLKAPGGTRGAQMPLLRGGRISLLYTPPPPPMALRRLRYTPPHSPMARGAAGAAGPVPHSPMARGAAGAAGPVPGGPLSRGLERSAVCTLQ